MTTLDTNATHPTDTPPRPAPYSAAIRTGLGICLVLAGLLNGGAQYLGELLSPDRDDFGDQIAWGADHAAIHQTEQFALLASMLFLPLGLLGLAQVARWHAPRLTVAATLLTVWGMWGFTNVVALGYAAGSVGPDEIGVADSVALNDGFVDHAGVMAGALYPHLLGSFLGLILLSVACWRSGVFPKLPLLLLVAFLVWDFTLPAAGALEPHLLLLVALVWLGLHLVRMPARTWAGATA